MPYKSKAQQGFMHAKHPEIAKRWDKETSNWDLPEHKHNEAVEKAKTYSDERNRQRKSRG